jgi:cysteine-rich repeat protein
VIVRAPRPLRPADATDAANASVLVGVLRDLGITVKAGTTILFAGTPQAEVDRCTAPFTVRVPHGPRKGRKRLGIGTADSSGQRMASNVVKLDCLPNPAVCGDGAVGIGEQCEDGNTMGCDGCSPTCHLERCGNGVVDCGEDCDDGEFNAVPGSTCSAECKETPPALRVPGGGSRTVDCALEWALKMDASRLVLDRGGVARNRQTCVDGDSACDFDPATGSCRFHLFGCVGGADARLGCAAASVASVDVLRPAASEGTAMRARLVAALVSLGLPAAPGEECTGRIEVDVAAGTQVRVKTRTRLASGSADNDTLKLKCLAGP